MILSIALVVLSSSGPRENRKALSAWEAKDTASALKHIQKAAAQDSLDGRIAFNQGNILARARLPGAEAAFTRSLARSGTRKDSTDALYNRGTTNLGLASQALKTGGQKPDSAAKSQAKELVNKAVDDLRGALKKRPNWNAAQKNLELALRLRKQCQGGGGKGQKPPPQDKPQDQQGSGNQSMEKQDAQRLMDAALAQEREADKRAKAPKETSDGPDW